MDSDHHGRELAEAKRLAIKPGLLKPVACKVGTGTEPSMCGHLPFNPIRSPLETNMTNRMQANEGVAG